ncbi:hypothetical protein [Dysgonomonas sp. 25]|uniref:hypothetical protein n=1 Tax=Dysgonomonas sp. 25 TaxID=2302933 RepID=UPI0013D3E5DC|nr:hypothetical protein [Dysgonomonas sp. 25]NDV69307.1 hypothetical protein [Dysgonomonas sp. 25]
MKKIVILFCLLLPVLFCPAQKIVKYGELKPFLGMKGKVKTLTEEAYTVSYTADGKEEKKLEETRIFEFAKNGELKKKTVRYGENERVLTYKEYKEGRAIRFEREERTPERVDKDSIRLYVVDNFHDSLVSWNLYNTEYAYMDTTLLAYSSFMNEIKPLANKRRLEIWEQYDERGNLKDEKRLLRGDIRSWYERFYDEDDLLIKQQHIEPAYYAIFYEYDKFDKRGNWCERKTLRQRDIYGDESDRVTTSLVIRRIKYY